MSTEQVSYQACPTIRRRVIGSNVWLLSFGDLVTLLLGFFVAIIAYAMQHPIPVSSVARGQISGQHGTAIAVTEIHGADSTLRRQLSIPAGGFDPQTGALRESGSNLLNSLVDLDLPTVKVVVIKSCFAEDSGSEGLARLAGISRSLAIVSQLLDAGVRASAVEVGVPSRCKSDFSLGGAEVTITGTKLQ